MGANDWADGDATGARWSEMEQAVNGATLPMVQVSATCVRGTQLDGRAWFYR